MIKLFIKSVVNNDYELMNNDNIYKLNIKFYDIEKTPKVGDVVYMSERLLDKNYREYSDSYQFGVVNSPYGRDININSETEIICVVINEKNIFLKRVFG